MRINNKGFTLVEVLVAILILSIVCWAWLACKLSACNPQVELLPAARRPCFLMIWLSVFDEMMNSSATMLTYLKISRTCPSLRAVLIAVVLLPNLLMKIFCNGWLNLTIQSQEPLQHWFHQPLIRLNSTSYFQLSGMKACSAIQLATP